jgi:hypothetical protein
MQKNYSNDNQLLVKQRVFQKALQKYGTKNQIKVLMEECAELCDVLIKNETEEKIISETVDVFIMIEQIKYILKNYLNDEDIFKNAEKNNIEFLDSEYDDPSIEKTVSIFLRLIYTLNHFDRKKVSSEELCKIICSADQRIVCISNNIFNHYSDDIFLKFLREYKRKFNKLKERLDMT